MQRNPQIQTNKGIIKCRGKRTGRQVQNGWVAQLYKIFYVCCVSADASIPPRQTEGEQGSGSTWKWAHLAMWGFWRLFKISSKAEAAECHGSHTSLECVLILKGRNAVAAPALQNATALVQRQINGLPSTLKLFAECMKRLVDNASPGACVPGHTKKTSADVSTKQKF